MYVFLAIATSVISIVYPILRTVTTARLSQCIVSDFDLQ